HYVPLGDSPAGKKYGRMHGDLEVTRRAGDVLVRLPLWPGLEEHLDRVIETARDIILRFL
ncbi:MAG: TDP-4-oxo-6-deoxy-D-glucose aminotransferase, partial [Gemmatimonadaceae bacterium]